MEVPVVVPVEVPAPMPLPIPEDPSVVAPVLLRHPSWQLPCGHVVYAMLPELASLPWLPVPHLPHHPPLPVPALLVEPLQALSV